MFTSLTLNTLTLSTLSIEAPCSHVLYWITPLENRINRSSCLEVFCKKCVLKNFEKSQKNTHAKISFYRVAGFRSATLSKKILRHRCFSANFTKFVWATYKATSGCFFISIHRKTFFKEPFKIRFQILVLCFYDLLHVTKAQLNKNNIARRASFLLQ